MQRNKNLMEIRKASKWWWQQWWWWFIYNRSCLYLCISVTKKWPPVGLLVMTIYICPNCHFADCSTATHLLLATWQRQQLTAYCNHNEHQLSWGWWLTVKCQYMLNQIHNSSCLSVCQKNIISLRAERRRREARREMLTYKNCTLSTIHLGPAGRRPAWA